MDCTYSCQKLKLSNVEESCGFSLGTELGTVRITPHLHYHVNNLDFNHIDQSRFVLPKAMGKMDDPQKLSSRLISSTETEGSERTLFICESCHRRFLFTAGDTQRHLSICAL